MAQTTEKNTLDTDKLENMGATGGGSTAARSTKKTATRRVLPKIDLDELVEVKSCFDGTLYFRSRSGQERKWAEYGMVHYMPVGELITMRNEAPNFFKNLWVVPIGENADRIIAALQLDRYYGTAGAKIDYDQILLMSPTEIAKFISNMSAEAIENLARRTYSMIQSGEIDSVSRISEIEKLLGYKLSE